MNSFLIWDKYDNTYKTVVDIKEVLSELEKEDKIIKLMAEELADWYMDNRASNRTIDVQYVIEKFTNKAEEDIKE